MEKDTMSICSNCDRGRTVVAKGMCSACYMKARRKQIPKMTEAELIDGREFWEGRFWGYVNKSECGCWEWEGTRTSQGYGMFGFKDYSYPAHRISHWLLKGPLESEVAMHSCDNPRCVNPDHLTDGTHKENMQDMHEKGRAVSTKGTKRPQVSGNLHWKRRKLA